MKNRNKLSALMLLSALGLLVGCGEAATSGAANTSADVKTSQVDDKTSNAGQTSAATQSTVTKVDIKTAPTKTEYFLNETFDGTGGVLTVAFEGGTTKDVDMTDSKVTSNLNTEKVGKKTVSIFYDGVKASSTLKFTVSKQEFTVTIHYNYEGKENESFTVNKNDKIDEPTTTGLRADNFYFDGWYTDNETFQNRFDFSQGISETTDLYAKWIDLSEGAYKFVFHYNYDGAANDTYVTYNKVGTATAKIADPDRYGYAFDGWFTDPDGGTAFDFDPTIDSETQVDVYAHYHRTLEEGEHEFVFEVENCDLTGKTGKGLSGSTSEGGMLVASTEYGVSGGYYLSYQYVKGNQIDFVICSDVAVDNVSFKARLSQEARDYTYTPSNYLIEVNGTSINYGSIEFTGVSGFTSDGSVPNDFVDYTIGNISLNKGQNTISFIVNNSDALDGTTMVAASPLIDCIKLTSTSVLIWDGSLGLPYSYNSVK